VFNVIVSFGTQQWQFMFEQKTHALAVAAAHKTAKDTDTAMTITDDFGTTAEIMPHGVNGILIEDFSKTGDAAIERMLFQHRAQAKGQNKAANDPFLKLSAPMMQPTAMNGMRRS